MEPKPKRIKGIEYPSSLSIVPKKKEYIADVDGYYKLLGIDPNEKNWSSHEIKDKFRIVIKSKGLDPDIIEAYRTLTSSKRISYDSLTKSLERLIEEVSVGRRKLKEETNIKEITKYSYYVDENIEENYELALEWMRILALINHRMDNDAPVKIVLSKKFKKSSYKWGDLVYVNTDFKPAIDVLAYFLLKDTEENWYLKYCKIIRNWDEKHV